MRGQWRYYLVGRANGKVVFDGPFFTESQAYNKASSIIDWDDNNWQIKHYQTEDLAAAKSFWKSERAAQTGSIVNSICPIRGTIRERKLRRDDIRESGGF